MVANRIEECPNCNKTSARRNLATGALHCHHCDYKEGPDLVTYTCAIEGCEATTTMRKYRLHEGQWVCHQHLQVDKPLDVLKSRLDSLSDDDRLELFSRYCSACGCIQPTGTRCQCANDD